MGRGKVNNDLVKRAKAIEFLKKRVAGQSTQEIAKEHNVSHDAVNRALTFAKRSGLFANYEDQILQTLVPSALKAIQDATDDGDAAVALEVMKMANIYRPKPTVISKNNNISHNQVGNGADEDILVYANRLRLQAQEEEDRESGIVDGEIRGINGAKLLAPGVEGDLYEDIPDSPNEKGAEEVASAEGTVGDEGPVDGSQPSDDDTRDGGTVESEVGIDVSKSIL